MFLIRKGTSTRDVCFTHQKHTFNNKTLMIIILRVNYFYVSLPLNIFFFSTSILTSQIYETVKQYKTCDPLGGAILPKEPLVEQNK